MTTGGQRQPANNVYEFEDRTYPVTGVDPRNQLGSRMIDLLKDYALPFPFH